MATQMWLDALKRESNHWDWENNVDLYAEISGEGIDVLQIQEGCRSSSNVWHRGQHWRKEISRHPITPTEIEQYRELLDGSHILADCEKCRRPVKVPAVTIDQFGRAICPMQGLGWMAGNSWHCHWITGLDTSGYLPESWAVQDAEMRKAFEHICETAQHDAILRFPWRCPEEVA